MAPLGLHFRPRQPAVLVLCDVEGWAVGYFRAVLALCALVGARVCESVVASMSRLMATEDQIHRAVAEWVVLNEPRWPELKLMFHCPNGAWKTRAQRGIFKAMLQRPGVPDLMLPIARGQKIGLAIELKSVRGQLSEHQQVFLMRLQTAGWLTVVCRSPEDAIGRIAGYVLLK